MENNKYLSPLSLLSLYGVTAVERLGNQYEDVEYLCPNCGAIVKRSEIEMLPSLMCPRCGFRGLFKLKRPGKTLFRAI